MKSITLFIFGGVSNIEREPTSPGIEFQMAFVGPLTSLVIGVLCFLLQVPLRSSNSALEGILFYLAVTNILLGLFNLIPGFPLDGGRVLRSIVWKLCAGQSVHCACWASLKRQHDPCWKTRTCAGNPPPGCS